MNYATGIFVDPKGYIYVSDGGNHRVVKWDFAGNAIGWIGHNRDGWQTGEAPNNSGKNYKSFYGPSGIYVDTDGTIYIADIGNHRVCKWSADGIAIGWIGGGNNGWQTTSAPSLGTDSKSFSHPVNIRSVSNGILYNVDNYNNRISKWQE